MRLRDKVAIVTGGAAGIGRATVELFAEEGARVVVADLDEKAGREMLSAISTANGNAVFVRTDVSREEDAKRLTQSTLESFGRVDILVNNAAAFVLKGIDAGIDDWQRSLGVNVIGTALVSRFASEAMKALALRRKFSCLSAMLPELSITKRISALVLCPIITVLRVTKLVP